MEVAGIFLGPIIQVLFDKLVSPAVSNYARRVGIDGQLKKLEEMLPAIRVVLADAEDKQMTNEGVKLWMEDLNDLAHDLDDLLDEFATETLRRQLITPESQASSSTSTSTSSKVRKLIPTCCTCFIPSRVVKLDHSMMSKVKEITTRLENIEIRKDRLDLIADVGGIGSIIVREKRETTSLVDKSDVYGRVEDKEAIVKELLRDEVSDHKFSVIPIVGMGGIGKTTLAQLLYNDEHVQSRFDPKVWVCVSDDFDVVRVTKTILETVSSETHDFKALEMFQQKLKEKMSGKRFLLVLDDVWNKKYDDWELLKRPFMDGAPGSKIIVTTRDETIASMMTLQSPTYPLKELSKDDCLSLFAHHALERENFDAYPDLKGIGEAIVNKCKGLPLAVKTLAGLLRTERQQSGWIDILNSKIWDLPEESNILPALRLSYHHLPSHLKQCFAYCATFPKDYEFDKNELVLLWMGVGLLQLSKEKNRMEYFGYKYFDDLLSRSFFQQSGGSKSRFVMHDLLNDLAQHVAGEICFRLDKLKDNEEFEIPKRARHLSFIRQRFEVSQKFRPICKVQHLRTLLPLQGQKYYEKYFYLANKVLFDLLPTLPCLRVLSLSEYSITELPNSIGDLKHLRYLNLSGTSIKQLPESVSTLYNLQTLLLHSCNNLCMLPSNIGNLINLRHLDITDTSKLREMCIGISRLTNLQTLSKFVVCKKNGARLKELGNVSLLRGSISIEELQNITDVRDANEANLRAKECLNGIELTWCSEFNEFRNEDLELDVLDKLQPHRNLERLKVEFYGGTKFPSWIGDPSFFEMVNLSLVGCKKCRSLPPLGQLPKLKELCIKGMPEVQNLRDEFYGDGCSSRVAFPSLETLIFENMPAWEEWTSSISSGVEESGRQFPCLHELTLRCCPKLIKVSRLRLPSLHKLQVQECPEVVLKSIIDVTSLTSLEVQNIRELSQLEEALVQSLVAVENVVIKKCNQLVSLWENGVACMNLLQKLEIRDCVNLEKLPNEVTCLTSLEIDGCSKLVCFPKTKTGVPHMLRRLEIRNCNALESLPEGISGLEHLEICDCPSLESLPEGISGLEHLEIRNCPSLESLPEGISGLEHLEIRNCPSLESLPEGISGLEVLMISNCGSLRSWPTKNMLPTTLKHLCISGCENLELVSETMRMAQQEEVLREFNNINIMMSSLEFLSIKKWPNIGKLLGCVNNFASLRILYIENCDSVESLSFPERERGLLPNLRYLHVILCVNLRSLLTTNHIIQNLESIRIEDCRGLESFGLSTPNLRILLIYNCEKLNSLPFDQIQSLASLEEIWIDDCPCLESFPQANFHFPPNLRDLSIRKLGKLKPLSEWGLHRLTSLREFTIEGGYPELVSFPPPSPSEEYCLLPTTLTTLWIKDLPNLKSISSKGGFHNLTSLQHLSIWDCPELRSLPKEGLPATLQCLSILRCPLVEKKGDYWPNIPCVQIHPNTPTVSDSD